MTTKFLTPIPAELHALFGIPNPGTAVYEQEGSFSASQGWYRALRRVVGEVISLPSVSLFVPVSRNAIHKRIKEGSMSCFKFTIKDTDPNVSASLNRERPHAFVPVSECLLWYQEFHDRIVLQDGGTPPPVPARELYNDLTQTAFDFHSKKFEGHWKEPYDQFQSAYIERIQAKASANSTQSE